MAVTGPNLQKASSSEPLNFITIAAYCENIGLKTLRNFAVSLSGVASCRYYP